MKKYKETIIIVILYFVISCVNDTFIFKRGIDIVETIIRSISFALAYHFVQYLKNLDK